MFQLWLLYSCYFRFHHGLSLLLKGGRLRKINKGANYQNDWKPVRVLEYTKTKRLIIIWKRKRRRNVWVDVFILALINKHREVNCASRIFIWIRLNLFLFYICFLFCTFDLQLFPKYWKELNWNEIAFKESF